MEWCKYEVEGRCGGDTFSAFFSRGSSPRDAQGLPQRDRLGDPAVFSGGEDIQQEGLKVTRRGVYLGHQSDCSPLRHAEIVRAHRIAVDMHSE